MIEWIYAEMLKTGEEEEFLEAIRSYKLLFEGSKI
jgi:hypothetical protein